MLLTVVPIINQDYSEPYIGSLLLNVINVSFWVNLSQPISFNKIIIGDFLFFNPGFSWIKFPHLANANIENYIYAHVFD